MRCDGNLYEGEESTEEIRAVVDRWDPLKSLC